MVRENGHRLSQVLERELSDERPGQQDQGEVGTAHTQAESPLPCNVQRH